METKLIGLFGICRRAGHLFIGFDAVFGLLHQHRAAMVFTASDISAKTAKEIHFFAAKEQVPLFSLTTDKTALAAAIGLQKPVGVIATDDRGFATAMHKHILTEQKED